MTTGQRPLLGMTLITASAIGFSCMHAVVRHVAEGVGDGPGLHSFEIAFFRNLFGLAVLLPFFLRRGLAVLHTRRIGLHLLRGTLQVGSMLMFFTAITITPLAQVSALSFTAPLFASVGALVFLGERPRARRIAALLLGFCGALMILRPGVIPFERGSALVIASSLVWAIALLVIKRLTATESSLTLTAWMGIVLTPLSLISAIPFWSWPSPVELGWLALLGTLGASSQFVMTEAFRVADATTVLPLDFSRLLWASLLGYFLYAETPGVWTWAGGVLIFGSATYIAYRESAGQRRRDAALATEPAAALP